MTLYHPSIEMLTDYAAGSLPLAHSLCVSAHLEHCRECQQQVRKLEMVGSHLFDQAVTDHHHLNSLKESLLKKLTQAESKQDEEVLQATIEPKTTEEKFWDNYKIPNSLRQFISNSYEELNWMRLSPSFKIATLHNEKGGAQIALTRVKAGSHMPHHAHTGEEITLVLEGAFSDESGVYRKGDFISRDASHKHKPIVTKDAECICLTVLDAPIEFTGWLARLLNPIIRRYHPYSGA
ncbi:ChrR family anti-sigma-E factor [Marinomonas sp. 2405UD66-6]|uniref:ChrR family anti-sigma-E factor n=1 Tax=Marinomonas sp. 2405UD66-6 TaxID=3391834 RepID=UPI0039C9D998